MIKKKIYLAGDWTTVTAFFSCLSLIIFQLQVTFMLSKEAGTAIFYVSIAFYETIAQIKTLITI